MTSAFFVELSKILSTSQIILDNSKQLPYIQDWRGRYNTPALAIVFPYTEDELISLIKLSSKFNIGIIPQGGNTGTCGGASVGTKINKQQIIISLVKLAKEYYVDKLNNFIQISANYTIKELQDIAIQHNLYFPLSIASQDTATVGGAIATNAGGIHVINYGMMRDLTLGINLVQATGEVLDLLNKPIKNNTGFDLKQIYIGSEGTLGIITKARVKVFNPELQVISLVINSRSIDQLINIKQQLSKISTIIAYEVVGEVAMNIWKTYNQDILKLPTTNWHGFIKLTLDSSVDLDMILEIDGIDSDAIIAEDISQQRQIWQIREEIPLSEKRYGKAVKHDISIEIPSIAKFIRECGAQIMNAYPNSYICVFGHLGDGNLHYNVGLKDIHEFNFEGYENKINLIVYQFIKIYNGSIAAEHGIGQLKVNDFAHYFPEEYNVQLSIKKSLDPNNILNPGKVVSFHDV